MRNYRRNLEHVGDGSKTRRAKKNVLERVLELCAEQGVDPGDTLSAEDMKRFMNMNHAEKNIINMIATGFPVRNAQSILRAIELKLERSAPKAGSENKSDQGLTITVKTESADPLQRVSAALPPEVQRILDPEREH